MLAFYVVLLETCVNDSCSHCS